MNLAMAQSPSKPTASKEGPFPGGGRFSTSAPSASKPTASEKGPFLEAVGFDGTEVEDLPPPEKVPFLEAVGFPPLSHPPQNLPPPKKGPFSGGGRSPTFVPSASKPTGRGSGDGDAE